MLWGHRAYSNKSALRLRYFRRSCALRALWSRRSCCFSGVALRILCWVFRRGYTPSAVRAGSTAFGGSAGDRVKPFLFSRAVPVSFSYGGLALFVLPLGVTG